MTASFRLAAAATALIFGAASASAATLVCSSSGQAYLISDSGGISTAGGCAGGPWAIDALLVPGGGIAGDRGNWRDNAYLVSAVSVLTRLPNRDLRWTRASAALTAVVQNLNIRGRLRIGMDRLPRRVVRSLASSVRR